MACCAFEVTEPRPLDASSEGTAREAERRARGALVDVVDAHTHLFPEGFYRALWRWFDAHAWNIRFRGDAEAVLDALHGAGASHVVALVYAHKDGVAEVLNAFLGELCRAHQGVIGVGTVLPGEPGARDVVRDAVRRHGLRGIKLHCHVQRLSIDDPRVLEVLAECRDLGVPAVVHAGRAPRVLGGYGVDPAEICSASRTEAVLRALPDLRIVVPHLGIDEVEAHLRLLEQHENLYLDTAMACSEYFDFEPDLAALERWSSRIMYGSDFPITPYEPEREITSLARRLGSDDAFDAIARGTACRFWQI